MSQEILRFGTPARPMIGALSMPQHGTPRLGFLLCRPFGAEATWSNAFFRALATRLVGQGCAVLAFDYHGTGESPGDGRYQAMRKWQQDIVVADAFLRRRTGIVRCHWFGLALGATLAAGAADATTPATRPAHVILWNPVESGRAYTVAMCARHRREMERWFRARWDVIRRDVGEPEPTLPGVVLGFDVGPGLTADLDRLDGLPLDPLLDAGVAVTVGRDATLPPWPRRESLRQIAIDDPVDWMTNHAPDGEEYRGGAIVPQDALLAASETLDAVGSVTS